MNKLSINLKIGIACATILAIALALFSFVQGTSANPMQFGRSQQAPATTTVNYFAVTATTTVYLDAGLGQPAFDSAVLAVQFTASSTTSVLNWRYEYANDTSDTDCTQTPTKCDWYAGNTYTSGVTVSTTTGSSLSYLGNVHTYSWAYASSSDACSTTVAVANANRGCKLVTVPTPTRYTRVVLFKEIGSTNGAVWSEFVSKKEK